MIMYGRILLSALVLTLAATVVALFSPGDGVGAAQSIGVAQQKPDGTHGSFLGVLGLDVSATHLRAVEGGAAASYTLRPSSDPGQPLTIAISNPDATAFTISPATLSFTAGGSGNWNVAQQVTITPLQDADAEHEIVSLTHSASGYTNGIEALEVRVYLADDEATDPPPVPEAPGGYYGALAQVSKSLVKVEENYNTGAYTVQLTADPGVDVSLNVNNPAPGELSVSPTVLNFTGGAQGNWSSPQTVSVSRPGSDGNRNDELWSLAHTHNTGAFAGPPVTVHVWDVNGIPDNTAVYGLDFLQITEGDPAVTYTVRMARAPANFLRVNLSTNIPKSLTVQPETLIFTRENWDDPQFVTVQTRYDLDSLYQKGLIIHRYQESTNADDWDSVTNFVDGMTIEVRTKDTWRPTPILERNSKVISNILTYDGRDPSYTVRLDADPEREITLNLRHDSRVTAYPRQLTFTGGAAGNWAAPQTVTLQALPDADAANEEIVVEHLAGGFVEASLPVTIIDGDLKSLIVFLHPDTRTMDEGESGSQYSVALADDPGGAVALSLASSHPDSVQVSPATLNFDSQNYHQPQTVTLNAPEDANGDNEAVQIVHTLPGYRQAEFTVQVQDNDPGGIVIWPKNTTLYEGMPLTYRYVPEYGAYRQIGYGIRLERDPGEGVTVKVARSSGRPAGASYDGGDFYINLFFTGGENGNWNQLQWLRLFPDPDRNHVNETYTVTHSATINGFTSASAATVHVLESGTASPNPTPARYTGADMLVVIDDGQHCADGEQCDLEPPPVPEPSLAPSTLHLLEEGEARRYSIFFSRDPKTDVTVTLTTESDNPASWSVAPLSFVFTGGDEGDWQTPRWVSVSGLADDDSRDSKLTIVHAVATTGGTVYPESVTAYVYDGDAPAVTISDTQLALNEGSTGSYSVALATNPVDDITITPTSSDPSAVTFSPSVLTFTASDWQTSQTVQVQAVQDADNDHETVSIQHAVAGYPALGGADAVRVAVSDDDGPTRPTVSITAGRGITEGTAASFTIAASPAQSSPLSVPLTISQNGDYAAAGDIGSQTATIPAGSSLTYTVDTLNDDADEPDGGITVTLGSGDGYAVSTTQATATVAVADDDDPPPPPVCTIQLPSDAITVAEVKGWRDENSNADHQQRWNRVLAALGENTGETPITVSQAQTYKGQFSNSRWGRTVRTLLALGQCDTQPELSIAGGSGITEGGVATFTVTATPAPVRYLGIWLLVTQSGDFGTMSSPSYLVIPTSGSETFTVQTDDDQADEADGWIRVGINPGQRHTVSATSGDATVTVADNDVPEISIAAGSGVTEGSNASFTLTASPAPASDLDVTVSVAQTGDFGVTTGSRTVTIPTTGSFHLPISTSNDNLDEADGSVTTTINTGTGYTVSTSNGAATVTVSDDDDPPAATPEISIAAGSGVTEGSDATFTITASPTPAAALTVNLTVSQSGDYGVTTGAQTVTIPTSGSYTLTVTTSDDSTDEADGSITVTVNTGTGYTVSATSGTATVAVADDDDLPARSLQNCNLPADAITVSEVTGWRDALDPTKAAAGIKRWNRVLATFGEDTGETPMTAEQARGVANWLGNTRWDRTARTLEAMAQCEGSTSADTQQTTPEISITAGSGVTEGGDATFTITASPTPAAALTVNVTVSQSGDYGVTTGAQTVSIPTSGSYTLTVTTSDDSADEADGSVTVTVNTGTGYTVSTSNGAATVTVADNDQPAVSITAGNGITEGGDATFTITASPTPASSLDVTVDVSQSGDYGVTTGAQTVTIPTSGSYTLTVTTSDDSTDEADGSVTATLNTGTGYTVSTSNGAATVTVADNDQPAVSITAGNGITEGSEATFTITASPTPAAALTVNVTVSQSGDYGASTGAQTVSIPTSGSYTLTVTTSDDSADEADGSVTVTVNTGTGYTVSTTSGTATVAVADDDDLPERSLQNCNLPADAITVSEVTGWRDALDPTKAAAGIKRWNRVLATFGEDTGETPMTAEQARGVANWLGNTRWDRTARTLEAMEQCEGSASADTQQTTPEISITAGSGVTEGSDATFTITASPTPAASLDVTVSVAQTGDFGVTTGSRTVTIPTTGSFHLPISTSNDNLNEADGSVTTTINTGTGYTVSSSSGSATVAISDDDDVPEISIAAGSGVTEGSDATFTITASPTPAAALTVNLTVSQSGDYGVSTGAQTVSIPTSGSYTLTVATDNDSADEADGSVTVTVNTGTGYTVSSSSGAATVAVADDDDLPARSLQNCNLPADAITVSEVTGWRDALDPTKAAAGIKRWNRVLATFGEDTGETPMTAEQARGVANWLGNTRWDRTARTLEAMAQCEGSASADTQQTTPEISITAGNGITEGGDATFTITASPTPASSLDVTVDVSQSGDYGVTTGAQTVTIPTSGSYTLTVTTSDDSTDEADGSVTATLNTGTGYTVSSSSGEATVTVADDDDPPAATPEISITAGSGVTEGSDATFTITASPTPAEALTVNVTVSQSGDYGASTGAQTVSIPTGRQLHPDRFYERTIATDEADGSVTATHEHRNRLHRVVTSNGVATVTVADNDQPEVSITAGNGVTEGGDATFTITASPTPAAALWTVTVDGLPVRRLRRHHRSAYRNHPDFRELHPDRYHHRRQHRRSRRVGHDHASTPEPATPCPRPTGRPP